MADKTPKRVQATWVGPPSFNHEQGELAPGDQITVWDHEVETNPHLAPATKAKPKPAEPDTESEA